MNKMLTYYCKFIFHKLTHLGSKSKTLNLFDLKSRRQWTQLNAAEMFVSVHQECFLDIFFAELVNLTQVQSFGRGKKELVQDFKTSSIV